jgi:threonyl-tRNA synthetase
MLRSRNLVALKILLSERAHRTTQVQRARAENVPIRIRLPDGSEKEGVKGVTTPQDILQQLPRSVGKKAVVAKVGDRVWDLFAPLEGDCDLQILSFEDPEGKEVLPSHAALLASPLVQRSKAPCTQSYGRLLGHA